MAPAQEKNPGYTGPDYGALYGGPPAGATDEYAYGYGHEGGYGAPGDPYGYDDQGYGAEDANGPAYGGPGEGFEADGGYGPEASDGPGPDDGYADAPYGDDQADDYASADDRYGPPPIDGDAYYEGEDARAYAHADRGMMYGAASHGPLPYPPAYEATSRDGYEAYHQTPYDPSGYRSRSYRAGSASRYEYDSGWRVQEGPTEVYGYGYAPYGGAQ